LITTEVSVVENSAIAWELTVVAVHVRLPLLLIVPNSGELMFVVAKFRLPELCEDS